MSICEFLEFKRTNKLKLLTIIFLFGLTNTACNQLGIQISELSSVDGGPGSEDPSTPTPIMERPQKDYTNFGPLSTASSTTTAKLDPRDPNNDVPIIFYYPVDNNMKPDGIKHTLLFVHGNSYAKEDYEEAFMKVASYGVLVAVFDFENNASVYGGYIRAQYQKNLKQHIIDQHLEPASPFFGEIPSTFSFGGHSWGSASAFYNALLGEGDSTILVDGMSVLVNVREWQGRGLDLSAVRTAKPLLHLNGSASTFNDDYGLVESLGNADRYTVNVSGAIHEHFMNSFWNRFPIDINFSLKVSGYFAHYITLFIKAHHTNTESVNSDLSCLNSACAHIISDDGNNFIANVNYHPSHTSSNSFLINNFNRINLGTNELGFSTDISNTYELSYAALRNSVTYSPTFSTNWPDAHSELQKIKYNKLKLDILAGSTIAIKETIGTQIASFDASEFNRWSMAIRQNEDTPDDNLKIQIIFEDSSGKLCEKQIYPLFSKAAYGLKNDTFMTVYAEIDSRTLQEVCDISALVNFELQISSPAGAKIEIDNFYFKK
ncbi:MAG: hypothetical protein AB8E15_07620 [Bdellovibrionales bacterium]